MASGHHHDRATVLLALPFGLLWWPLLGPAGTAVGSLAFLTGGLWLSPDLDIPSRASRRWGPLQLLWWPYRRMLRHRSPLSHSPLLGTALRLTYLAGLLTLLALALSHLGWAEPQGVLQRIVDLCQNRRPLLIVALLGVEASCWLHLIQDGDPTPRRLRLGGTRRRAAGRTGERQRKRI